MQIRLIVYIPIGLHHATVSSGPGSLELVYAFSPSVVPGSYEAGARDRDGLGIAGLDSVARATRRETVKAVAHARGGHLGGPLSAIDVLVEFLHGQGFLGPEVAVAHVVYATSRGIELLAQTDTPVAHCPAITAKRGRFAPIRAIYAVVQGR